MIIFSFDLMKLLGLIGFFWNSHFSKRSYVYPIEPLHELLYLRDLRSVTKQKPFPLVTETS